MSTITDEFLAFSRTKLVDQCWPRMRSAVESLSADELWWRPNDASNSIGNLLTHLNGNVRQWLVVPFTGMSDQRDRPAEFAARTGPPAASLLHALGATVDDARQVLERIGDRELLQTYQIQGYAVRGLEAVYHVVEHFAMHYGQVLYITKQLRATDLGFYKELDRTGRTADGRNP